MYLSQYLGIDPSVLETYGALDTSVASDLPLFIDPFLLFNSSKPEYRDLHAAILKYLRFLRDKAQEGVTDPGLLAGWFEFKEVKQNWLGFTVLGNGGHGLGPMFARSLDAALRGALRTFGSETVTKSSHLEKIGLLGPRVGRDTISDFTTNLIKDYLLAYTQSFAREYLEPQQYRTFGIRKVRFNYDTESWEDDKFDLPVLWGDFVLLTPRDMLTRDDTWISHADLVRRYHDIPEALPNAELRAQVNTYFRQQLGANPKKDDYAKAVEHTIEQFPDLVDVYIRLKENEGDKARSLSEERVRDTVAVLVEQLKLLVSDLRERTDFYKHGWSSYDEALQRALLFKDYVENKDGYKLINRQGRPFAREDEVQLYFGLAWFGSLFDVNREPNNGRGPVDFKISVGAADKSLIEFKLASNSGLKRNLQKQVAIYEAANDTTKSVKVIICYTASHQARVQKVLSELKLLGRQDIIVVDARSDNKPSASKA